MIIAKLPPTIIDLTGNTVILTATFDGNEPQLVALRIDLSGSTVGVQYLATISINGIGIAPDTPVSSPKTTAILQSRNFIVNPDDAIAISLKGGPADLAVTVSAYLISAGFNHDELVEALSVLQIKPLQYVLAPLPQPVHHPYRPLARNIDMRKQGKARKGPG